ncbi:hypothetical protein HELRODRAFT_66868 [Helobdella robusta]|uniref:G-protein coupled receptors family 1 profile domain-containing protein n=1 Tax=Helobdella robusta TaxID=6412 RepID=T1FYS1_HELRO|nr:hypothetical protein HELRODRAFT_66868 [Helobdella robusta]ESN98899.1 hypothetical protein HELRODRAFT_66868 [Helobdella robusta]
MPENLTWIGNKLSAFDSIYQPYHGYICLCVCCFGFVSNLCNIIVLTRKNMISPFNQILTALALADLATIISYIPYATYFYCVKKISEMHNYWWVLYLLFNTNFIITTHTIAMWLTVFLAVFRYLVVCHPTIGSVHCNQRSSLLTIIFVYLITPLMCIPIYIQCYIAEDDHGQYWYKFEGFATEFYKRVTYFIYAGFFKLAPCILLTVLSFLLIVTIKIAEKKRQQLLASRQHIFKKSYSGHSTTPLNKKTKSRNERTQESVRTTVMLVAVVLSFVFVELPQGVLVALSGINYSFFFMEIYKPLGDIFDLLGLLNSIVNFVLYCTMSRQFRETFVNIFFHCCINGKQKRSTKNSKETKTRRNDCKNCLGGCCGYKKFCLTTSAAVNDHTLITRHNHTKQR